MSKTYYSPTHEYITVDGNIGYIGISDYAQHALGNVVYVDMPDEGDELLKVSRLPVTLLLLSAAKYLKQMKNLPTIHV